MNPNVANSAVNGNMNLNRKPHHKGSFGLLVLGLCAALVSPGRATAQTEEATSVAPPVIMPQYSTLTSTDGVIQASRLPVTYNGKAYYVDLTLALTAAVSSQGVVTIAATPTAKASINLIANNFKAGTYVGPSNINGGKNIIVVSGPSALPNGGSVWTLTTPTGASADTYPNTAVWYVEPIADSPLASRLSTAKITSPDYSYGIGTGEPHWCNNSLLGFAQAGNSLSISNFSDCADYPTPYDNITYTLQP